MTTRYQVLITDGTRSEYKREELDFRTKSDANKKIRELRKQGVECELWDCYNNPLSNMFKL